MARLQSSSGPRVFAACLLAALAPLACSGEGPSTTSEASTTGDPSTTETSGDATSDGTTQPTTDPTSSTSAGPTSTTDPTTGPTTSGTTTGPPVEPCNGHAELCDRPYNEVVFPTTHNANSALSEGYSLFNANHTEGIDAQLEYGVRGMLIDVHWHNGETHMCHGPCGFGNQPHVEGLNIIKDFLDANPREVLTIIYQDEVEVEAIVADYDSTGLADYVFTHEDGAPWPTLGEMIDAGTRLVVTAESGSPPPGWYHHVWDVAWDTPYSFMSPDEFSCELNRGDIDNDLFLMNHWVNNQLDLPSEDNAAIVNQFDVLYGRAQQCWSEADQLPNYIAIDFFKQGDLIEVADAMNGF